MDDLPDNDIWAPLYHLATVATELAEKESAKKVEKEESHDTEKVIKNEKLKVKEELVLENENSIKNEKLKEKEELVLENENSIKNEKLKEKEELVLENVLIKKGCRISGGQLEWLGKKKRYALNMSNARINSHCLVGSNNNEKKSWNVSLNQAQEIMIKEKKFDDSVEGCSKSFEGCNSNEKKSWNVSLNQVQESTIKKRNFYGSGEGCSSNNRKQSRLKTERSENVIQIPSPELPEAFKNAISRYLNGGNEFTGELMLVLERNLSWSDTNAGQSRLALRTSQILCEDFLKPNEKSFLSERNPDGSIVCMEVKIIEPTLKPGKLDLRFWKSNSQYSLTGKWKSFVENNNLEEGDFVQLWAFRIKEKLCFALCTVPSRKIPKKERKK